MRNTIIIVVYLLAIIICAVLTILAANGYINNHFGLSGLVGVFLFAFGFIGGLDEILEK